jgi:hypothetical protein
MGWRNVAAGLGTGATVQALKAAEGQVGKRKYKRLIATAVAELLALHPDTGRAKARRRARRLTGARPSKKLMRASKNLGWKETVEGLVAAAATAGIAKVAAAVGERVKDKAVVVGDKLKDKAAVVGDRVKNRLASDDDRKLDQDLEDVATTDGTIPTSVAEMKEEEVGADR